MKRTEKSPGAAKTPDEQLRDEIESIVQAEHSNPFEILGPHWVGQGAGRSLAIRAFRPDAQELPFFGAPVGSCISGDANSSAGIFEVILPASAPDMDGRAVPPSAYRLRFRFANTAKFETYDPYAFPPLLTEYDLYLSGEGTDYLKYEKLGAHVREIAGVQGVHFAVWAPNAQRVSVVGDFNFWDGRVRPMRNRGASGHLGTFYSGAGRRRALQIRDSFARRASSAAESPIRTDLRRSCGRRRASVVCRHRPATSGTIRRGWRSARARDWLHSPMSIYEVHAGLVAAQEPMKEIAGSPIANWRTS